VRGSNTGQSTSRATCGRGLSHCIKCVGFDLSRRGFPPPHCVARIANTQYTAVVSIYSTGWSTIVMDAGCVLCEVGAEFVCTV